MDIELEKKIELLEWQRDNALRLRCPLAVSYTHLTLPTTF